MGGESDNFLPPTALCFSATDPTGGAGLQADIMTLLANGCYPLTITTAITAQDSIGVSHIESLSGEQCRRQINTLLDDLQAPIDAVKIGLAGSLENIQPIVETIKKLLRQQNQNLYVVCDPVLASGRGDKFVDEGMMQAMCEDLLPLVSVLTPNSSEAMCLASHIQATPCDDVSSSEEAISSCSQALLSTGCAAVIIKGADNVGDTIKHHYYDKMGDHFSLQCERLPNTYHGSGCTFAAAITAGLAHGKSRRDSIQHAHNYSYASLQNAYRFGCGQLIPNRMHHQRCTNN